MRKIAKQSMVNKNADRLLDLCFQSLLFACYSPLLYTFFTANKYTWLFPEHIYIPVDFQYLSMSH